MPKKEKRAISETYQKYALGLAKNKLLEQSPSPGERDGRRKELVAELVRRGVKGWPERGTFYTGLLAPGCIPCLGGRGSNLCLTTLCTRDCFFCFNPKPRAEGISVHGLSVSSESDIPGILAQRGIRSVGISGGEPLLKPDAALRIIKTLRDHFHDSLRIDLYSNGDMFTPEILRSLRDAGLSGLRLNLASNGYNPAPLELALTEFSDASVEIPIIPSHAQRLQKMVRAMANIKAPRLIMHELFVSAQNVDALRRLGMHAAGEMGEKLTWSPVAGSDESALELFLYCMDHAPKLSVFYCSTGTQEWIAENALAHAGSPSA
ncbi:MAG TPA: radical SAM protein [Elusimicrobiota bacterium]|nr:radical SAM protein [Elusimicrobiota bacterium]